MTNFARSASTPARMIHTRLLPIALAGAAAVLLALAPRASAIVTEVSGTTVGLQPRNAQSKEDGAGGSSFANAAGNPVLPSSQTFVIYWDPSDAYHPEWQRLIDTFMANVGAESGKLDTVFAADTQYTDRNNEKASYDTVFRGAYTDTHKYPTAGCTDPQPPKTGALTCLTDAEIREELKSFIAAHGLPTGMGSIFYLMTPPGVTVCLDAAATHCSDYVRPTRTLFGGKFETEVFSRTSFNVESKQEEEAFASESYRNSFCSYHAAINPGGSPNGGSSTIIYGVIPWVAGSAGERAIMKRSEIDWAYECQDGGYAPNAKGVVKRERPKEESAEEEKSYSEATREVKEADVEIKERETPHVEEPEQTGLSEDGMYDGALADLIVNQVAVEQQNIVTDPLLNAWQDSAHREATDECRNYFLSGSMQGSSSAAEETNAGTLSNQTLAGVDYYLNDAFNLAADKIGDYGTPCIPGITLEPKFTSPNPVNIGEVVGFDGMESDITLNWGTQFSATGTPEPTYAWYTWTIKRAKATTVEFEKSGYAPGAPVCETPWASTCAASEYYTFSHPGTYEVTLRAHDVGGNEGSVTHDVTVAGPGESEGSGESHGSGGASPASSGAGNGSSGAGSGTTAANIPAPTARAAVVSHSLTEALGKGLAVMYSVNEQVAGHFEVLLSAKLAHQLGISGPLAVGMPVGSEPKIVIAKALLVTIKGGRSVAHIKFSKRTAERLRRVKKVALEVRLIVHNAAQSPASTIVVSTVTLGAAKHDTRH